MSTDDETNPDEMSLVMPFVACKSKGGPYDDDAYAAGYEAGLLDALLAIGSPPVVQQVIRAANQAQADLIAMRHGYSAKTATFPEAEFDGWVTITLTKIDCVVRP